MTFARSTRIRPISLKRRRGLKDRAKCRVIVMARQSGMCAVPTCPNAATDLHEKLPRGRDGDPTSPENCVGLCRPCHCRVTDNPAWAFSVGLTVSPKLEAAQ